MYLQDGALERGYGVYGAVVYWADAVEAEAKAHHVEVVLWEALDACRVADVAQYLVAEGALQGVGSLLEALGLQVGEVVKLGAVATGKV